jgi:hypothetical protein
VFVRWFQTSMVAVSAMLISFAARPARADGVVFGPNDVRSVFYVSKSENQNQVHYGLRVDDQCRPMTKEPVFAYWRRLKKGVRVDDPLVGPGRSVYGASEAQDVRRTANGWRVRIFVRAAKKVPIEVHVRKAADGCRATAFAIIRGETARLSYAFLQLARFGLGVKYLELVGFRTRDGARVTQKID